MRRSVIISGLLGLALVAAATAAWILTSQAGRQDHTHQGDDATQLSVPLVPPGTTAPDFTLVNQDGVPVQLSQLRGKVLLLNFIYTHCPDFCPLVTASLVAVQRQLAERGLSGLIAFVSVTTDPVRDAPEALKAYASKYQVDERSWVFLTGAPEAVRAVLSSYGIAVQVQEDGSLAHALPTLVIAPDGQVLGAYPVEFTISDVVSDLSKLAGAPAS